VHQKFIDFKKANDLIRKEVWYIILIEFGMPRKLVRIIKSCLVFRSYSKLRVPICLILIFHTKNGMKKEIETSYLL
jgi:hypothetical protein